jgi:hypothetical protein
MSDSCCCETPDLARKPMLVLHRNKTGDILISMQRRTGLRRLSPPPLLWWIQPPSRKVRGLFSGLWPSLIIGPT